MALKSRIGPVTQVQVALPPGSTEGRVQVPEAATITSSGVVMRTV